jgi:hypothetical protein
MYCDIMETDIPIPLELMRLTLMEQYGFRLGEDIVSPSSGNRILTLIYDPYVIRIVRERGIWSVDIGDSKVPNHWYHTGMIREAVDGMECQKALDPSAEREFWSTRWPAVLTFFNTNGDAAHEVIRRVGLDIVKRRNPRWFARSPGPTKVD